MSKETLDLWRKHEAESVKSDSIVASCNCNTKTPEVKYHAKGCKYRLISERNMLLGALNGFMPGAIAMGWDTKKAEEAIASVRQNSPYVGEESWNKKSSN